MGVVIAAAAAVSCMQASSPWIPDPPHTDRGAGGARVWYTYLYSTFSTLYSRGVILFTLHCIAQIIFRKQTLFLCIFSMV